MSVTRNRANRILLRHGVRKLCAERYELEMQYYAQTRFRTESWLSSRSLNAGNP